MGRLVALSKYAGYMREWWHPSGWCQMRRNRTCSASWMLHNPPLVLPISDIRPENILHSTDSNISLKTKHFKWVKMQKREAATVWCQLKFLYNSVLWLHHQLPRQRQLVAQNLLKNCAEINYNKTIIMALAGVATKMMTNPRIHNWCTNPHCFQSSEHYCWTKSQLTSCLSHSATMSRNNWRCKIIFSLNNVLFFQLEFV